ncbi:ferritin family protein [Derxia gummosa]|uniref:Ferritin family protein n=1 Tax=Derxia gummosa DSM 723 TaxID=1121388 RepID=A0A8B6X8T3_9BURK|nr:ferritin family protein [Derxia gummosa]
MANVTFSSPIMPRDITVYAVAGDRGTLLALAKAHHIPIPFDCQDGECGSCVVETKNLDAHSRHAIALTEKEKEMLRQLGKITPEEIREAEVNDVAPRYRLACQCFVRDEDSFVSFDGDHTLPAKGPALSTAAGIYKGGVEIHSLDEFLSFAVKLEEDAARHYETLAEAMAAAGNPDVAGLFRQLGGYSRLHLEAARARCERYHADIHLPADTAWPENHAPERTGLWAGDPELSRLGALKAALEGETRGYEFYYRVANTAKDAEVRKVAKEFVREEAEHVENLRRWIETESAARSEAEAVTA